jgi:formiminoglutamase
MNPFQSHKSRPGEKQLGDLLKQKTDSEGDYIFLLIPEDIGVRANGGRPGAANNSSFFYKAISAIQVNEFIPAEKFGWSEVIVSDLQELSQKYLYPENKDELRSLVEQVDKRVFEVVKNIIKKGKTPLILGGGHNNAYPLLKALSAVNKEEIHALNLDPHPDCRNLEGRHSGNSFSYAKENGFLKNYAVLGMHENGLNEESLKKFTSNPNWQYFSFESWTYKGTSKFLKSLELALKHVCQTSVFGLEICADGIKNCPSSAAIQHGWSWDEVFNVAYQSGQTGRCDYIHLAEVALPLIDPLMQMSVAKSSVASLMAFVKGIENPNF